VIFSPEDSTQGAWSAAMLTAAEIIPALVQKWKGTLTLHHATLVMNFATLSTLASLAAAPRCSIWRSETSRKRYVKEGKVGRIILSVALLFQVSLSSLIFVILLTRIAISS
jgi:hypothetical protein